MSRRLFAAIALVTATSALLVGCSTTSGGDAATPSATASATATPTMATGPTGAITVFAAASLTGSFTTLGKQFEAANPGTTVTFSFGGSSSLATQITEGAPADVFASASVKNMDAVVAAAAAGAPATFAKNAMEIAVPPSNPAHIAGLSDLAKAGVKVALCQPEVPCGAVAAKVLTAAGVTLTPVTLEADVKATLTKVQLGEVDAGIVYVTDVLAAGDKVTGVKIPADVNASTSYPIATLTASKNPALAKAFADYVLSADGASVLTATGFQKP
ncbi:MAG: molybdate ABC transporter substrate-binding protein [Cellulomonas sp.]